MNEKEFQEKWQISRAKLLKMAPYIEGAKQCPNCKKWEFPDNAVAIYIPDKREHRSAVHIKNYAYVMDAIVLKMELMEILSTLSDIEVKTAVRELKKEGLIVLLEGKQDNSLCHLDYMPSIKAVKWQELKAAQKRELLTQIFRAVANTVELIATCVKAY
jgi:hypothetical protein